MRVGPETLDDITDEQTAAWLARVKARREHVAAKVAYLERELARQRAYLEGINIALDILGPALDFDEPEPPTPPEPFIPPPTRQRLMAGR
jgi:hypothetical protein